MLGEKTSLGKKQVGQNSGWVNWPDTAQIQTIKIGKPGPVSSYNKAP